jgi:hypothetical protein
MAKLRWPQWPYYIVLKKDKIRFFKIGGRSKYLYVDLPYYVYENVEFYLGEISDKASTIEEAYNLAKEQISKLNEDFKRVEFDFVNLQVRKSVFGKPKINLIININRDKFDQYLENLARSNTALSEKYTNIASSRLYLVTLFMRNPELVSKFIDTQQEIKMMIQKDLDASLDILNKLTILLSNLQKSAESRYRHKPIPFFYYFLPEIVASINSCVSLINGGLATSVYREFRRILEIVSYSVFLDSLLRNTISILKKREYEFLEDYTNHLFGYTENHYNILANIKEKDAKGSIVNLKDFESTLKPLVEDILTYTKLSGKNIGKRRILKIVREQISFPLFYYLFGVPVDYIGKNKKELFKDLEIDVKKLYDLSRKNLIKILTSIQDKKVAAQKDIRLSEHILDKVVKRSGGVVAPALRPTFLYEYSGKLMSLDIRSFYRNYSTFIHLYPNTTQILPFSSILEYKILKIEVEKFSTFLNKIVDKYQSKVFCS